jgi:hypothetical protein
MERADIAGAGIHVCISMQEGWTQWMEAYAQRADIQSVKEMNG